MKNDNIFLVVAQIRYQCVSGMLLFKGKVTLNYVYRLFNKYFPPHK